ncbi:hypothetical protein C4J81_15180 [Deltaproteobacteria bacterium Smac51]|nr:hypothetical protein C4J81_15180 [Deltaproteobacteria bacterium Smac51]
MKEHPMIKKTVCFSGYRPEKFSFIMKKGVEEYLALEKRIEETIIQAVDDGYDTFLCGMAMGFDLVAGSIVVALKESWADFANLNLVAVLPFEGHGFVGDPWHILHQMVLGQASQTVTLSSTHHPEAYHDRNRYMVERSSRLICYYNGKKGGTDQTVKYAKVKGVEIVNVF